MIKKIADLKGYIDCPYCFSRLSWDNIDDIQIFNGNKYIVCPQCGKNIFLNNEEDYWLTESGNSLPSVTQEDQGKILKVVNGVWSKADNDSSEETWVTVFDGSVVTTKQQEGAPAATGLITLTSEPSGTIKVIFEGNEYECEMVPADPSYYGTNVFNGPVDWSVYPFCLMPITEDPSGQTISYPFFTENASTYSLKIEALEESGGSSDFSIANVTFLNEYGFGVNANFCEIAPDYDTAVIMGVAGVPTGTTEYAIPLYQGAAHILLGENDNLTIETRGRITYDGDNDLLIIEGNGGVTFKNDDK